MLLPGAEPGLLWTPLFAAAGPEPRLLPGPDPGLLIVELVLGESANEEDKAERADDFEVDWTGLGFEESEPALESGLGLTQGIVVLMLSSLDPYRPVREDDGETDPTRPILEPEVTRDSLEVERVGRGLDLERTSELEPRSNSEPGFKLVLKLALESEGSRFDSIPHLEPTRVFKSGLVWLALISVVVLISRQSLEPIPDLQLGLTLESDPVLESKLSFDPQLVLKAEPLLESRLSLDPMAALELGLTFSEAVFESRLSFVTVVALEFELDLNPEPMLESLLSRLSMDPDA